MKTFRLVLLSFYVVSACFLSYSCKSDVDITLRVMTFNTRVSFVDDGENSWNFRKDLFIATIIKNNPDILCVQESTPEVLDWISSNLPQFSKYGLGRDSLNTSYSESCHIFYNTGLFNIDSTNSGTFWFSKTPHKAGSKGWGANFPRICTYTRFIQKKSGKGLYVYNNHWDHQSVEARDNSAKMLIKSIKQRKFPDEPCIVAGDFNAEEDQNSIQILTGEDGCLYDTYRLLYPAWNKEKDFTMHKFEGTGTAKIDYVFITDTIHLKTHGTFVEHYNENNHFPSDHFPVVVDVVY